MVDSRSRRRELACCRHSGASPFPDYFNNFSPLPHAMLTINRSGGSIEIEQCRHSLFSQPCVREPFVFFGYAFPFRDAFHEVASRIVDPALDPGDEPVAFLFNLAQSARRRPLPIHIELQLFASRLQFLDLAMRRFQIMSQPQQMFSLRAQLPPEGEDGLIPMPYTLLMFLKSLYPFQGLSGLESGSRRQRPFGFQGVHGCLQPF